MRNHESGHAAADTLLLNDCYPDRATTGKIERQEGEIIQLDPVNLGIQPNGSPSLLLPCNLPAAFQQSGLKIVFSGLLKEIKPTELFAGQPFVLTHLEKT